MKLTKSITRPATNESSQQSTSYTYEGIAHKSAQAHGPSTTTTSRRGIKYYSRIIRDWKWWWRWHRTRTWCFGIRRGMCWYWIGCWDIWLIPLSSSLPKMEIFWLWGTLMAGCCSWIRRYRNRIRARVMISLCYPLYGLLWKIKTRVLFWLSSSPNLAITWLSVTTTNPPNQPNPNPRTTNHPHTSAYSWTNLVTKSDPTATTKSNTTCPTRTSQLFHAKPTPYTRPKITTNMVSLSTRWCSLRMRVKHICWFMSNWWTSTATTSWTIIKMGTT